MSARLRWAAGVSLCLVAACAWVAADAHRRRSGREREWPVVRSTAQLLGGELALHAAARWLRHPARSEPWAAAADAPAMLDVDPAGSTAPPATSVLVAGLPRHLAVTVRVRRQDAP